MLDFEQIEFKMAPEFEKNEVKMAPDNAVRLFDIKQNEINTNIQFAFHSLYNLNR